MNDNQIGRRKFIQYSAEGVALAASGGSVMAAEHITMNQEADKVGLNIMSDIDVLVVGGGTAGTIAAIQACKSRCKNTSGGKRVAPNLVGLLQQAV
jgi:hypothetical protein